MLDYSQNGSYGEVKFYSTAASLNQYESVDCICSAGWHKVNDRYQYERLNGVAQDLILFTLDGQGYVKIGHKRERLVPGTIAIIPARSAAIYGTERQQNWEFQWLHYAGVHVEARTRDIVSDGKYVFELTDAEFEKIARLIDRFVQNDRMGLERLLLESEVLDKLLYMVLCKSILPQYSNDERQLIEEIADFIENAETLRLNNLAEHFHYSREHIVRIFKKATGMTPYYYWKLSRMKRSCNELIADNKPIKEIALQCGFKNVSSYNAQFRNCYGVSPGEYRKMHRMHEDS